jgi:peroxiredoxin
MNKRISLFIVVMTIFLITTVCLAEVTPPQAGSTFPAIEFPKPSDSRHLNYLGLSGSGNFKINQIKADVLIVEIFSMYCPYCQGEAPNINRLYKSIESNPSLKDKIKIIGIGIGNSTFETDIFKNKYKVEFPLLPDGDFKLHKIIGEVRTPYFFVIKLKGKKPSEVIYSKLGVLENIDAFLAQIIKSSGLK